MGDIADMMIEGILDANGEYTGRNPGHPVYHKGWFGKPQRDLSKDRVHCFLNQRGFDKKEYSKVIAEYAERFGVNANYIRHANDNWKVFKAFVDEKAGFIKPSKQPKYIHPMGDYHETHFGVDSVD